MTPKVSIILLVKNEITNLPRLFTTLEKQKFNGGFEIIAVDSGSKDGSREFLKKQEKMQGNFNIRLYSIKPQEFGHGKTRNFATDKAKGIIFVFLTADALPQRDDWLRLLTKPIFTDNIAATFCKLIPYPTGSVYDEYFDSVVYPAKDRTISKATRREIFLTDYMYYSNVCGAIKREVFEKIPFDEDKIMSEDQWWGRKAVDEGYTIKYVSSATVMHSHIYSLNKFFDRQFTSGYSLIGIKKFLIIRLIVMGIPYLIGESYFLLSRGKVGSFLYMFIHEGLRFSGFVMGVLGDKIPVNLRNKLFYYLPLKKV